MSLSLSDNQMALLQGPALALPVVLAAVPLGLAIDRYSRVRLILLFSVLDVVGGLLTAASTSFAMLFAARCLVGLSVTVICTAAISLLADLYSPEQRGRAKGVVVVGQYAGSALAFALGGGLLVVFGANEGWRWAMLWMTSPLLLAVLLTLTMREPPRTGIAVARPAFRDAFVGLWRRRALVVPLMAGFITAEIAIFAVMTWAAPTLSRSFGLSPEKVGAIMATTLMVSGVIGPLLGGGIADLCQRLGGPRLTVAVLSAFVCLCAPLGLFAIAPSVAPASVLLVLFITCVGATASMGLTLVTVIIPNELRGLCLAILAAGASLFGVALAPVAVSVLSGALGGPAEIGTSLTVVCITASLSCAGIFMLGRRHFPSAAV